MITDETQTPVGTEEAQLPVTDAGEASETTSMATPSDAPAIPDVQEVEASQPDMPADAPAPEPQVEQVDPPQPTEPEPPSVPSEPLPASDPEPEMPVQPADPVPQEPGPAPATPADPMPAPQPPAQPQGEATTEPAAASAPPAESKPATTAAQDDANLFDAYMSGGFEIGDDSNNGGGIEGGFKKLAKGDRVEATIIQVDRDRVFVDLGTKAEGVVPLHELGEDNIESAKDHYKVGDKINVVVLKPESGAEGPAVVSKRRAEFEEAWDRIEEAFKEQVMITAQVVDRVKGGLVVDVGVRGFVPATHVGNGKLRNIEKYVGHPLQLKVIEIDRDRKKVVLSNRQAEEERRVAAKENIFTSVHPGDILEGTVRRLTDYGAFIDLGGVDGLLHISEMSWMRINHPKEMFKEGQKIKVMVLRLDPGAGKLSLGHRQVLPDPWNLIKQTYKVGQNLTVTIGRIVQGGAFVKLPEGAEAFIPVSEMSFRRIKRPQDVIEENQEVEVQVIDLRTEERRMVLSMRAIGGGAQQAREGGSFQPQTFDDDFRKPGGKPAAGGKKGKKGGRGGRDFEEDFEEVAGRRGFATGGATIGERLGMLKGFLNRDEDEDADTTDGTAVEGDAEVEDAPTEA